jgi:NhaP-type Na+/H+ and K+/H+ antiporter
MISDCDKVARREQARKVHEKYCENKKLIAKNLAQIREFIKKKDEFRYRRNEPIHEDDLVCVSTIQDLDDKIQKLFEETELVASKLTDDIEYYDEYEQKHIHEIYHLILQHIEAVKDLNK